jgi:hypothetical protein
METMTCDVAYSGRLLLTFWRSLLPPSSVQKCKNIVQVSVHIQYKYKYAEVGVLTSVNVTIVSLSSLVGGYQLFGGASCLHLQCRSIRILFRLASTYSININMLRLEFSHR